MHGTWNEEVGHGRINAHLALLDAFNASVHLNEEIPHLTLFPNPASDKIHLTGVDQLRDFVIYDTYGRIHLKGVLQNSNAVIHIESLKSGLYFISVNSQTIRFEVIK